MHEKTEEKILIFVSNHFNGFDSFLNSRNEKIQNRIAEINQRVIQVQELLKYAPSLQYVRKVELAVECSRLLDQLGFWPLLRSFFIFKFKEWWIRWTFR